MGATGGSGKFLDWDWKNGISAVQQYARQVYGDEYGYSGAENSCSFSYKGEYLSFGKKTKKAEKELKEFIDKRLENLGNGCGEVIRVGLEGYNIFTTEIKEFDGLTDIDTRYYLKNMKKGPAVLLRKVGLSYDVVSEGTVSQLKSVAHQELRHYKYLNDFYIVSKYKIYKCYGKRVFKQKTTRVTNDNILVLPLYSFVYYGWYRS